MTTIYWTSNTNEYTVIRTFDPELYAMGTEVGTEGQTEDYKKLFEDGPKLKFIPSDKFVGYQFGYVFFMGDKGLGYYLDPMIMRTLEPRPQWPGLIEPRDGSYRAPTWGEGG